MCLETNIVPSKCVNIAQLFSSCAASSNDFLISKQSKPIYGCVRTVLSCQLCPNKLTDLSVRCTLEKNEQKWKIKKIVDRFVSLNVIKSRRAFRKTTIQWVFDTSTLYLQIEIVHYALLFCSDHYIYLRRMARHLRNRTPTLAGILPFATIWKAKNWQEPTPTHPSHNYCYGFSWRFIVRDSVHHSHSHHRPSTSIHFLRSTIFIYNVMKLESDGRLTTCAPVPFFVRFD